MGTVLPVAAQYSGPAILTRGEAPSGMSQPQVEFRPFVSLLGGYSTGLAGVSVDQNGNVPTYNSYTAALDWGVSGSHSWRHTLLGLDYHGSVSHYVRQGQFDAVSNALLLGLTQQLSRHMVFSVDVTGEIFNRDSAVRGLQQSVPFDPSTLYAPTQDYFNNRTIHSSTQARLVVQRSARLSLSFGGGFHFVNYRSSALRSSRGYNATGDIAYRLSRRNTIGAAYQFGHFGFDGVFGGSDFHGAALTFGTALTKRWELSGYAGFARIETTFVRTVPLDPVIVALLGITTGQEVGHSVTYIPNYAVRMSRTFQNGVFSVSVGHSVVPGNGLFLTSFTTRYRAQYNYTGLRRWSLGAFLGVEDSKSQLDIEGHYLNAAAGLSLSRRITGALHFVSHASVRRYKSRDFEGYTRTVSDFTIGLGFTPGDIPLRIW